MKEWQEFLAKLESELGADIVQKWVPKVVRFDAANIYLEPADSFQMSWFEEHVRPKLKGFLNANNRPIKVQFLTEKKDVAKPEIALKFQSDKIDPEMSFERFVPSGCNLVAYKLLMAPSFNPIYIYGPPKSGKTHLLMAAAHLMQKKSLYVRAETFTEHVVQAIRFGQMQSFRKVYRDIDALLIDDIQIFGKKGATQEEFFHTFNTLQMAGKQIIISANVPPSQLRDIEERLISRFEWGISLEIGKSDPLEILNMKAKVWQTPLPLDLSHWLIKNFPNDPISAFHTLLLRSKQITIAGAEKALSDLLTKEKEETLTYEAIVKWVATHYGITSSDILGKSQMRNVALPRQVAMYYCREKLKLPYQKIGELFCRDHSTVMSSIKQIQKSIEEKTIELPPERPGVIPK